MSMSHEIIGLRDRESNGGGFMTVKEEEMSEQPTDEGHGELTNHQQEGEGI